MPTSLLSYALIALSLLMARCAPSWAAPGHMERSVMVDTVDPTLIRAAIIRTLNRRRHQIDSDEPNQVTATIESRGARLHVAIPYHATGFDIQYLGSEGFEHAPDATPENDRIDGTYVRWMSNLRRQIDRNFTNEREQVAEAAQEEVDADRQARVDVAQAEAHGEQAALDRERLSRMPPPQPAQAAGPQANAGAQSEPQLRGGFNVTQEPNGLGAAHVRIVNESANPLRRIVMRRAGERRWLPNQLTRTVPPGAGNTITGIRPGVYEMRVENGRAYKEWSSLTLRAGGGYTLVVTTQNWYSLR